MLDILSQTHGVGTYHNKTVLLSTNRTVAVPRGFLMLVACPRWENRLSKKLSVAVVGAGYFGRFHCEKMHSLPNVDLVAVVDTNPDTAQQVASQFSCKPYVDHRALLDQGVHAAVISVPSISHFPVASDLLQAGIDLLVEKPLATSEAHAHTLCQLAEKKLFAFKSAISSVLTQSCKRR